MRAYFSCVLVTARDHFKFCVNSKSDIRFVNSYEGADRFCPYLYYTGDFSPVNAAS